MLVESVAPARPDVTGEADGEQQIVDTRLLRRVVG